MRGERETPNRFVIRKIDGRRFVCSTTTRRISRTGRFRQKVSAFSVLFHRHAADWTIPRGVLYTVRRCGCLPGNPKTVRPNPSVTTPPPLRTTTTTLGRNDTSPGYENTCTLPSAPPPYDARINRILFTVRSRRLK